MKKKKIIIIILLVVVVLGAIIGYFAYKKYLDEHEPNANLATQPVVVPQITTIATSEMAVPNEPKYPNPTTSATGLYPTLSGKYETIWDGYESFPIEIVAKGSDSCTASYKLIWSKNHLYIQVAVNDTTPDVSGSDYMIQDSVEFFINEDGQKNSTLLVGDAHYIVNRNNVQSFGRGASEKFDSVTYEIYNEDGTQKGYVVEVSLPLLTIKGSKKTTIGFDIQINDCVNGSLIGIRKWASDYLYTFQNFSAVGSVTFK